MGTESSAGGVVYRQDRGLLEIAIIRPRGKEVWALPKGHVDGNETPAQAATREVLEETGLTATLVTPLGEVRYVYQFRGKRIFKKVAFFLFEYASGTVGDITPEMRVEVDEAKWIPLSSASEVLTYRGEKTMVSKAIEILGGGTPSPPPPRQ